LCGNSLSHIPQISSVENIILTYDFTEEEVYEAISQMEHKKVPGPDEFPFEFYLKNWSIIKNDLMALFIQLQ
jgi:hypothetical protein